MKTLHAVLQTGWILLSTALATALHAGSGAQMPYAESEPTTYVWTGATLRDGNPNTNSNAWETAANWNPMGVPGAGDMAIIALSDLVTLASSRTVYGLQLGAGTVRFLEGPGEDGTLTTTGDSTWSSGTFEGIWQVPAGATLEVQAGPGSRQLAIGSGIDNHGTVTWTGGTILGYQNCTVVNHSGGVWIFAGDGAPFADYYSGNQFSSYGEVRRLTGTGNLSLQAWTYTFGGSIVSEGGPIQFLAATHLLDGLVLSGGGTCRFFATTHLQGGAEFGCRVELVGGTFNAAEGSAITGQLYWGQGTVAGAARFEPGATLHLTGTSSRTLGDGASLDMGGALIWEGGHLMGYRDGLVTIRAGGSMLVAGSGYLTYSYLGNRLLLEAGATLLKTSADTNEIRWAFDNHGEVTVTDGMLMLSNGGTSSGPFVGTGPGLIRFAGGTHTLQAGSNLAGNIECTTGWVLAEADLNARIDIKGGTVGSIAPAEMRFTGTSTLTAGSLAGITRIPTGAILRIMGSGSKQLSTLAVLEIEGLLRWEGSAVMGYDRSLIRVHPGGVYRVEGDGNLFTLYYSGNRFVHSGTLEKVGGDGVSTLDHWSTESDGAIRVDTGTLALRGQVDFLAGATLAGPGPVRMVAGTTRLHDVLGLLDGSAVEFAGATMVGQGGEAMAKVQGGEVHWTGGTLHGVLEVDAPMWITGSTGKMLAANAELHCHGDLVFASAGNLTGYNTSLIHMATGNTLRIEGPGSLAQYYSGNRVQVAEGATLLKAGPDSVSVYWLLENHGTVLVEDGMLNLIVGGSSTGPISGVGDGLVRFSGGTFTLDEGASLAGAVEVTSGTVQASADVSCRVDFKGGTLGSTPPAVLSLAGESTWTAGTLAGLVRIPPEVDLLVSGGTSKTLGTSAIMDVEGLLHWTGGGSILCYNTSTVVVHPDGILRVAEDGTVFAQYYGANLLVLDGRLEKSGGTGNTQLANLTTNLQGVVDIQQGAIVVSSPLNLLPGASLTGPGLLRIASSTATLQGTTTLAPESRLEFSGGTLRGHDDEGGRLQGGAFAWTGGTIQGQVTLATQAELSGTSGKTLTTNAELRNAGTLDLGGSGNLLGYDRSTLRNLAGGTLNARGSMTLTISYGGNTLINEGLMTIGASPGRQNVNWAFEQSPSGRLQIEVAGADANAPEFDRLHVTGGMTLAGSIESVLLGGYQPPSETLFSFLTGSTLAGVFAVEDTPGFTVEYSANTVSLRAVESGLGYGAWAVAHGLQGDDALPGADTDGDGIANFLEYALNLDPNLRGGLPVILSEVVIDQDAWLVLRYRRWLDRMVAGVNYVPERAEHLGGWTSDQLIDEPDPDAGVIQGSEARRARIPLAGSAGFLRLRVE